MTQQKGFSLIEIIVILAIVAILTAASVVGIQTNQSHRQLKNSTDQFISIYHAAMDASILQSKVIRLSIKKHQLVSEQFLNGNWQALSLLQHQKVSLNKQIDFDLSEEILLYPSGKSAAFDLYLSNQSGETVLISGDAMGRITLKYENS